MPRTLSDDFVSRLRQVVGPANVISRPEDLLVYECDAYTLEKNLPNVVVLPRSTDEVAQVVRLSYAEKIPIIPRGAGTSLSGAVLAVEGGVMIALTRMNRIVNIDYENRRALVEAGCVNAWITTAVRLIWCTFNFRPPRPRAPRSAWPACGCCPTCRACATWAVCGKRRPRPWRHWV